MATTAKKTIKPRATKNVDVRHKIKPRGLCGMFKGTLIVIGKDEDVFGLGLDQNVG